MSSRPVGSIGQIVGDAAEWLLRAATLTRPVDSAGPKVPCIGLGLAALGRPGYINIGHACDLAQNYDQTAMQAHAWSVLDAAWACGIRYFDAARSYGLAEQFLANWLTKRKIEPSEVLVGSKWGYTYTASWRVSADKHEIKDHSLAALRRQLMESVTELSDYLSLYQIHSATLESGVLDDQRVLEDLTAMRERLGIKIGLSVSGPRQKETIFRALETGVFDCVQATWNMLEPSSGQALMKAHDAGLGVIIKEALANGRLTERNNDPTFASKRTVLEEFAGQLNCRLDALGIAVALAQPWVDIVLSGATTVEQIQSNVRALDVRFDESPDTLIQQLVEKPEEYWTRRGRLAWN